MTEDRGPGREQEGGNREEDDHRRLHHRVRQLQRVEDVVRDPEEGHREAAVEATADADVVDMSEAHRSPCPLAVVLFTVRVIHSLS